MKKEIGLWIDHRRAVIVTIEDNKIKTSEILSSLDKESGNLKLDEPKPTNISDGSHSEDIRDRRYGNNLDKYYDEVIHLIGDADSIWIFGPGEGKIELENRIRHAELGARVVGIEASDNLTNSQLTAKVWGRYRGKQKIIEADAH